MLLNMGRNMDQRDLSTVNGSSMELDLEMSQHDVQNAHANSQSSIFINKKVWSRRYFALDPGSVTVGVVPTQ